MPIFGSMGKMNATLAALVLATGATGPAAEAGSGYPDPFEVAQFRILPGWRTPEGTHMAGLHITLAPGWKTYWRAPGDAGIPPELDWSGSRNLAGMSFHWPVPKVFHQNGLRSIGYSGEVLLPMELVPDGPGTIALSAELSIGVCEDVCMPMHVRLRADLPAGARPDPRIGAALRDRPMTEAEAGVVSVRCTVEPIDDGLRMRAEIAMPALPGDEVAVFETADPRIWVSESAVTRQGGALWAESDMVPPNGKPFFLNRSDVRITVIGGDSAVDIRGCDGG